MLPDRILDTLLTAPQDAAAEQEQAAAPIAARCAWASQAIDAFEAAQERVAEAGRASSTRCRTISTTTRR